MKLLIEYTPAQRAARYLKRIAALTGAVQVGSESYRLKTGRRQFLVDSKFARVVSHRGESTCFSVATAPDTPSAEVVASALLQLKNNPKLFEKWTELRGYTFKANGTIFRDPFERRLYRLLRCPQGRPMWGNKKPDTPQPAGPKPKNVQTNQPPWFGPARLGSSLQVEARATIAQLRR